MILSVTETGWLCATCLRRNKETPAVTLVRGTALCAKHLRTNV